MLKIGLTGGIGCGKSTVSRLFNELGITVIDADEIAHELVQPGQPALDSIVSYFGKDFLLDDGNLDRAKLRTLVFSDSTARKHLEDFLHPLIKQEMLLRSEKLPQNSYCIFSIPLIFEHNWTELVDSVLVVDCSLEQQISRTTTRDNMSEQEVRAIIASQINREQRLINADDIIDNSAGLKTLTDKVHTLHKNYLRLAQNKCSKRK